MMVPLSIARAWVCDPDMQGLTNALPCDRDIFSNMGHRGVLCKAVHIVPAWSELDWHFASSSGATPPAVPQASASSQI